MKTFQKIEMKGTIRKEIVFINPDNLHAYICILRIHIRIYIYMHMYHTRIIYVSYMYHIYV